MPPEKQTEEKRWWEEEFEAKFTDAVIGEFDPNLKWKEMKPRLLSAGVKDFIRQVELRARQEAIKEVEEYVAAGMRKYEIGEEGIELLNILARLQTELKDLHREE